MTTPVTPTPVTPTYVLLHVDSPAASARFYARLLGLEPIEASPTFSLFVLPNGLKLGLWSKHTVEPRADGVAGSAELGFTLADHAALDALWADWTDAGVPMIQPPTDMDFGRAFTGLDPDGHRLRAYVLAQP